jgi:hypothetical protein
MTELRFLQASRVAKPANAALNILVWVYQNSDLQGVFFLGLVGALVFASTIKMFVARPEPLMKSEHVLLQYTAPDGAG